MALAIKRLRARSGDREQGDASRRIWREGPRDIRDAADALGPRLVCDPPLPCKTATCAPCGDLVQLVNKASELLTRGGATPDQVGTFIIAAGDAVNDEKFRERLADGEPLSQILGGQERARKAARALAGQRPREIEKEEARLRRQVAAFHASRGQPARAPDSADPELVEFIRQANIREGRGPTKVETIRDHLRSLSAGQPLPLSDEVMATLPYESAFGFLDKITETSALAEVMMSWNRAHVLLRKRCSPQEWQAWLAALKSAEPGSDPEAILRLLCGEVQASDGAARLPMQTAKAKFLKILEEIYNAP